MKKTLVKRLCLILAAVLCMGLLTGCGSIASGILGLLGMVPAFNPEDLVQGNLDAVYLNQYTEDYLDMVDTTAEALQAKYEEGIAYEVEFFAYYFDIALDICDPSIEAQITQLYQQIYPHSKYEVGTSTKNGDTYLVSLTVYPIDLFQQALEAESDALQADWDARVNSGEFDNADESTFETAWAQSIIDMVTPYVDRIGYLDPVTVSVQITQNSEGAYSISQSDFDRIDELIIAY